MYFCGNKKSGLMNCILSVIMYTIHYRVKIIMLRDFDIVNILYVSRFSTAGFLDKQKIMRKRQ